MTAMWNSAIETMRADEMRALQLQRLQDTVKWTYERVPMYKKKLDDAGVEPACIKSLEDIRRLPFTEKEDLRQHYPYGLFAVPMRDIVRIHASSGTTGQPTVVGYTREDLDMWTEAFARLNVMAGATPDDIVQISFGYGLFTGALGAHQAWEKIGATVVPISSGNTQRQISLMHDFGVTALVATPSYAMYMCEVAESMGLIDKLKLRIGVFGAESSTEEMRAQLESRWGIIATENYGLSEIVGPGVSGECIHKTGMHINEDLFYCEIINPETGEVLPDGEWGEMVITPLKKQALPLLRYRTHDITRILRDDCPCGRTLPRMQKITGRSDDMLIVRGVNVFPSQIEGVLMGMPGIGPHYEITLTRENYLDKIEVKCELVDASLLDSYAELEALTRSIREKMRTILQLDAKILLVSPGTLKRFEGKAKRVSDLRE